MEPAPLKPMSRFCQLSLKAWALAMNHKHITAFIALAIISSACAFISRYLGSEKICFDHAGLNVCLDSMANGGGVALETCYDNNGFKLCGTVTSGEGQGDGGSVPPPVQQPRISQFAEVLTVAPDAGQLQPGQHDGRVVVAVPESCDSSAGNMNDIYARTGNPDPFWTLKLWASLEHVQDPHVRALLVGMAATELDYGREAPRGKNNLWNIKRPKSTPNAPASLSKTWEVVPAKSGKRVEIEDWFLDFPSVNVAASYAVSLLKYKLPIAPIGVQSLLATPPEKRPVAGNVKILAAWVDTWWATAAGYDKSIIDAVCVLHDATVQAASVSE